MGLFATLRVRVRILNAARRQNRPRRFYCARVAQISLTVLISVALAALGLDGQAFAQTPHSVTKTCGYEGGPGCPSTAVTLTNWQYWEDTLVGSSPGPWASPSEAMQDISSYYLAHHPTYCSGNFTAPSPSGSPGLSYGIPTGQFYTSTITFIYATPSCPTNWVQPNQIEGLRSLSCPTGYSIHYQTSPLIGPYCTLGSATPIPNKQTGCPTCSGTGGSNSGGANAGSGGLPKADSVDVSNANLYKSETDYSGAGSNPIRFVRSYNLLNSTCSPKSGPSLYLGGGWSATYFQYLLPVSVTDSTTTYNTVYAYRPDGRVIAFNEYNGVYSPDGDVAESLIQTSSGWQYQTADDTIETYNAAGQLLSIAKRGQAPITVNYAAGSAAGDPPASVSDAFGHSLQLSYAVNSGTTTRQLASITDPAGHTISYTHNGPGQLTAVTQADGTTRSYSYTSTSSCNLTGITDEASVLYASWTYNSSTQPATFQNAGAVNAYSFSYSTSGSGGSVQVTDPLGKIRTYNQSLIWGAYHTTSSSAPCPSCGEDASRVYDSNGNITTRTDYNGNVTTYSYSAQTNLETSRTEAYGTSSARTISTQWDPNWRQPDSITEPNRTTSFSYDSMGNVLTKTSTDTTVTPNVARTWTYTYDSYGRMLTAKGPRTDVNSTTTYAYYTCTTGSQCGQLQTVTDPVGNVTTYNTYNAHGQPLTITDPNGVVTTLTYDNRLRLTSRQVGTETTSFSYYPTGLLKQVTLPDSSYVLYTYDNAHRLTEISDGAGNSIQYTLDNMGNRTAEKTYDPSQTLHRTHTRAYNTLNELYQDINAAGTSAVTTTYGYDNNANQTSVAAPLSRNTTNYYDPLNRLDQITDPNSGNTYFGYDAEDDLTSVKDPRSLTTSYGYNGFGDVTTLSSPDTGSTTNTYDSGGNLSTSTDARNAVSSYTYDVANRVTSIAYKYNGTADQTITFGYDSGTYGKGRLTSASDANHSLAWTYDFAGRIVGKGLTVGTVNLSVGYAYTNGDRTALVTPSGQSVAYGFNSNHQITSITVNGTTVLSGVKYEPFGGVDGWTWGDNSTTSRTFNGDGLISQIMTAGVTLGYSFDNANRITGITDSSNSALTWTYGYDLLDRLTSATTSVITDGWTYDANGNRLTQTGTTPISFSVSTTNNQLNATTGGLVRSYSYDAAGHTEGYGAIGFTYNNRGRMEATNASSTDYLYNALGQMIEKSGTLGTTVFVQDEAGHLLGEYNGSGALIEETIWLGDIPVATLQPNGSGGVNIFYVHSDHLNSPRKVAQPTTGTLAWRWDADPFGTAAPNQNPAGLGTFAYNLRFPGQYYMAETGLNQNKNRDYDAFTGRYVESDPIGLQGGINTYSYVGSNPLTYVDPWGLAQCTYSIAEHSITCVSNDGKSAVTSSQGISSGLGTCKNNNSCSSLKMLGPVEPDTYNISANTLPGRQGWWALQSTSWTPGTDGLLCRLGLKRCGFNLHLGTYSEGCITFDKNDPAAQDAFKKISNLFSADAPTNTLTVIPNTPKPLGAPHP
jgi:RHS repeat-associated protein